MNEYTKEYLQEVYDTHDKVKYKSPLYYYLLEQTSYLIKAFPKQRLWHVLMNTTEIPVCKTCGIKRVKWDDARPFRDQQYREFCSQKCSSSHPDTILKKHQTELEIYGEGREKIVEQIIQTNRARYGVDWAIQLPEYQQRKDQTIIDTYGSYEAMYAQSIQTRNVHNENKWGMKYPQQLDDVKAKTVDTIIDIYGSVSNRYQQSQEKFRETCEGRYSGKHSTQRHITDEALMILSSKDALIDLHHTQKLSITQISDRLGINQSSVKRYLDYYEIEVFHYGVPYSIACIKWLESLMESEGIYIQHAENGTEFHIPSTNYRADGYCRETNTIYEYHGDYWHGNLNKYNADGINQHTRCTFNELYSRTMIKEQRIRELGYNLVVKWETE